MGLCGALVRRGPRGTINPLCLPFESSRAVARCAGNRLRSSVCTRWPMALKLNIGKCTLLGNYRENNEDSIDVKHFPDLDVCIVADGMGGQAAGEVASKRATEVIPRELRKGLSGA